MSFKGWICDTPGCGHNRSFHRDEWDRFRGVPDTSCAANKWAMVGREQCRCGQFTITEKEETA